MYLHGETHAQSVILLRCQSLHCTETRQADRWIMNWKLLSRRHYVLIEDHFRGATRQPVFRQRIEESTSGIQVKGITTIPTRSINNYFISLYACLFMVQNFILYRYNVCNAATGKGLEGRGSISGRSKRRTQSPIQWISGAFPSGIKRQGREAHQLCQSSVKVKNAGAILPLHHISSQYSA
jgi:hypothetical protein